MAWKKILGRGSSVSNPKRCAKPIVEVFYINGILNDEPDIKADAVRLSEIVKDIAKEIGIHINTVEMIYDPTDGVYDFVKVGYELFPPGTKIGAALKAFFIFGSYTLNYKDNLPEQKLLYEEAIKNKQSAITLLGQKVYSTAVSRQVEMINKICDRVYESIRNGNMVLLVAHSNGNSYMNDAYKYMSDEEDQSFVRLLSIASPQSHVGKPGNKYPYVTRTDDLVIGFLPYHLPANFDPINTNKGCVHILLGFSDIH